MRLLFLILCAGAGLAACAAELPNDLIAVGTATDPGTGLPLEVKTRVTGHVLRLVPPGNFTMGSETGDADESPVHQVTKSAYYLGKYPVTNEQYERYDTNHRQNRGRYATQDQHPVTRTSWNAASAFINWVGQQEGTTNLYAMPSEAAWEKASQGGLTAPQYPWGDTMDSTMRTLYTSGSAVAVTAGSPNGLGFFHMTGNVFCWCWDWYEKDYYAHSPAQDPYGPTTGKSRSLRGGTWYIYNKSLRCADRWHAFPEEVSDIIGVRIGRRLTDIFPP